MKFRGISQASARLVVRSPIISRWLVKLRDLLNAVLAERLHDGIDQETNGEAAVVRALAPGSRVFIDVGANVGDWSDLYLRSAGPDVRGILVEPGEQAGDRLSARFSEMPGVEIVRSAASDREGTATFYGGENASEGSSLVRGQGLGGGREVPLTTVDRLADELALAEIDFLKIDAEGHDLSVLRGAVNCLTARRVSVVQFEYHRLWTEAEATLAEALHLLRSRGYEVFRVRARGLEPAAYRPYLDYFGYSNYLGALPEPRRRLEGLILDD